MDANNIASSQRTFSTVRHRDTYVTYLYLHSVTHRVSSAVQCYSGSGLSLTQYFHLSGLLHPRRWNSCKQNKQAANNRAATANQTPSPEGEKLHSDSGISVDSQSLQEQQAQAQAAQQAQAQTPGQGPTQSLSQTHAPEQIGEGTAEVIHS